MNKKQISILLIAGILVSLVFVYFFINDRQHSKRYQWFENYHNENDQPYGNMVIYKMLSDYYTGNLNQHIDFNTDSLSNYDHSTFIFIGNSFDLAYENTQEFMDWINSGNDAFIASNYIPYSIAYDIGFDSCDYWEGYSSSYELSATANFYHPQFQTDSGYTFERYYKDMVISHEWSFIDSSLVACQEDYLFIELGSLNSHGYNFIKVPYGAGNIILHTNPILFTNFFLIDSTAKEYADKVFSHFTQPNILWCDKLSTEASITNEQNLQSSYNPGPLQFILSEPSLRWAWYLLLVSVILYTTFQVKRKQRIIPVIEPKVNTTLEFAETIGRLYYQQNDHKKLAELKMKHFYAWIRRHYKLNTGDEKEKLIRIISEKSGVNFMEVALIFEKYTEIKSASSISSAELIILHNYIDQFYQKAK